MPSIEARITGIEQDASTGWYRITTDHERVKRLDTKIREKAEEAAGLKRSGAVALIDFTEKQGNPNPHAPGTFYMNRYYEQAGAVAEEIPVVQQSGRKTDPGDAWRMCLNKGGEMAVRTLPLLEQRSFEAQKQIAYAWAEFFFFTPPPGSNPSAEPPFSTRVAGDAGNGDSDSYQHSDADIPF